MDYKNEIVKIITSMSGRYSSYDIFSDWIKCASLSITNSITLFTGYNQKVFPGRSTALPGIIRIIKVGIAGRNDRCSRLGVYGSWHGEQNDRPVLHTIYCVICHGTADDSQRYRSSEGVSICRTKYRWWRHDYSISQGTAR